MIDVSRRAFLGVVPAIPAAFAARPEQPAATVHPRFPAQEDETVREIVTVAHGNLARVKELVSARPALARASWDWGYGDWETPVDAASHVGNRPIAEFLIANGARPTIFTAVMLGQLAIARAWIESTPGLQRMRGPHGLTMMAHARAGGADAARVLKYLETLGDADPRYPDAPLTDAEQAAIIGEYGFSAGATDRLRIAKGPRGLTIQRSGQSERGIFHHGGLVFNPAGAEAVRIRVEVAGGRASTLTVEDGPVVARAARI